MPRYGHQFVVSTSSSDRFVAAGRTHPYVKTGLLLLVFLLTFWFAAMAPAAGASTVSGTVSAQGSPVAGATVEALDINSVAVLATDTTGAGGGYSLSVLAPSVDIRVTSPPGSGLQVSTVRDVDTSSDAQLDIVLIPVVNQFQLSGVLRDEHGDPVQGAIVQLAGGAYVYTDAGGNYSFTVTPGTYSLYVYGDNLPGLPMHFSFYQPGVTVNADRTLDLNLPSTVSLTFKVQDPDGNPVPNAQIVNVYADNTGADLGAGLPGAQGGTYTNGESITTDINGFAHFTSFAPVTGVGGVAVPNQPGLSQTAFNISPFVPGTTVAIVFPATDHTPPQAHLDSPPDGATFGQGQSVIADFACDDEPGGSGMSRCEGTVPDGQPIDTSTPGNFTFEVTAVDRGGNSTTVTHHYSVAPGGTSDVEIDKTASPSNPRPGDVVTYRLVASNPGDSVAHDVVITDALPAGVTFVSADAPCTQSMATVTCGIGSLDPGEQKTYEVKVTVDRWGTAETGATHMLDIQKVEAQIDLTAGEQRTISVDCPSGFLATDGSVRIDQIDQGTGDWTSPQVLESRASSLGTWRGTVKNTATGRAQAKVFAVCIRQQTNTEAGHSHNLAVSAPVTATAAAPAGIHEVSLQCGPRQVAIQPGFVSTAPGDLIYSQPDGNGWRFRIDLKAAGDVTFSIRCLARQVSVASGHSHDLRLERIWHQVTVDAGRVNEAQLTCADGSKGTVAGWDLDHGLLSLGNDPRPVTRAYRLYNPTGRALTARLSLLCLGDRTAGEHTGPKDIINTAYISTSSDESNTADNMSSATVTAEDTDNFTPVPDPPPVKPTPNNPIAMRIAGNDAFVSGNSVRARINCSGACRGTAKLVAPGKARAGGQEITKGSVLAKGRFRLTGAGTSIIRLKATATGSKLFKSKKQRKGLLTLTGGASRLVTIRD